MVTLAQIMFPIVVLLGLTGLVVGILQAGGQFGPTAFVPVLWNVVIIVGLVVVTPLVSHGDRIYVYAVGDRGRDARPAALPAAVRCAGAGPSRCRSACATRTCAGCWC